MIKLDYKNNIFTVKDNTTKLTIKSKDGHIYQYTITKTNKGLKKIVDSGTNYVPLFNNVTELIREMSDYCKNKYSYLFEMLANEMDSLTEK